MGGEDLVVVVRGQVAFGAVEGPGLLDAHHDRVGEAAQQHDQAEDHVHDADALVVDGGEPLVPEVAPEAEVRERGEDREAAERHDDEGDDQDRLVQRQRGPGQPAEEKAGLDGGGGEGFGGHRRPPGQSVSSRPAADAGGGARRTTVSCPYSSTDSAGVQNSAT